MESIKNTETGKYCIKWNKMNSKIHKTLENWYIDNAKEKRNNKRKINLMEAYGYLQHSMDRLMKRMCDISTKEERRITVVNNIPFTMQYMEYITKMFDNTTFVSRFRSMKYIYTGLSPSAKLFIDRMMIVQATYLMETVGADCLWSQQHTRWHWANIKKSTNFRNNSNPRRN